MSLTALDAVLHAALTALRANPPLAGGRVYEDGEVEEIPEADATAVVVGLDSATPVPVVLSGAPLQWTTVLRVECFARRNTRAQAGANAGAQAATTLHAQAHARLMADPTLGGVAGGVELLRIAADRSVAATRAGVLVAFYAVSHRSTADGMLPA